MYVCRISNSLRFYPSKSGYTVNVLRYLAGSDPTVVLTAKAVPYSSRPEHKQVDKMFWATLALENDVIGEIP
jgi:predicted dehydrogenase